MVEDLGLGEDGRRLAHEVAQDLVLGRGEGEQPVGAPHLTGVLVHRQVGDLEHGALEAGARGAAQDGPQPRHELFHGERLDEVVVAASGEARDPVRDAVAGGEEDDGHHRPGLPQPVEDGESVEAGQHQIEHHDVGVELGGPAQRVLTGVRGHRLPALVAGDRRDEVGDGRVVVHDQEAHFFHPLIVRDVAADAIAAGVSDPHR